MDGCDQTGREKCGKRAADMDGLDSGSQNSRKFVVTTSGRPFGSSWEHAGRRCSSCGKDSAASSKIEDFYELELNIKGLNNLEESLDDYFSQEELDGENQYFCESCQKRVDATRCIKLRSFPPVINIQLKRYVFLPKTTTKKKISSTFRFPGQFEKRLSNSSSSYTYELAAILIHKGTAASSGHYVAHVKDESNGQWWEFDDETLSKLGLHPFGENPGKKSNKGDQKSQGIPTAGGCADFYLRRDVFIYRCLYADVQMYHSIDNGPIQCEHGKVPASKVTSIKRLLAVAWLKLFSKCLKDGAKNAVSADVYRDRKASLKRLAEAALAGSCPDGPSYFVSKACQELSDFASVEGNLRAVKLKQRQNHEKLISGKSFTLNLGKKYYLVPSSWLSEWRAYIIATGKNVSSLSEPQSLEAIVNSLICGKHSRLLQRPLDLVCKHGSITQKTSNSDGLTMIPEYDWKLFSEEWSATPGKVCEECIGERESCALVEKLNYQNEDIHVYLSLEKKHQSLSKKRLKLFLYQIIVKENQKLHKGYVEIEDDFATLADKSIFPGDVLWVRDSEIYENRDIADEISEQKGDLLQAEEGFRGTFQHNFVRI
ncbi:ubiquitin carboxyl-terminal hydrolase 26 [Panicum miliaceum]|uniref:ubiquitinyl hydrolase 1 n=1 Tax=Panicum miliaceum TaxID=4540 RepID=A0A3L6S8T7_PANMI|nr:ubiquitin carboxyl-terminal hydrolase 26 [Panicum miliaceum]